MPHSCHTVSAPVTTMLKTRAPQESKESAVGQASGQAGPILMVGKDLRMRSVWPAPKDDWA